MILLPGSSGLLERVSAEISQMCCFGSSDAESKYGTASIPSGRADRTARLFEAYRVARDKNCCFIP